MRIRRGGTRVNIHDSADEGDDMPEDTTDVEDHPHDYTGLHAFAFIEHVDEGTTPEAVVEEVLKLGSPPDGPVLFASPFVGDYVAFVHVRAEDLAGLQDTIERDLWPAGVHTTWSVESDYYRQVTDAGPVRRGAKRKSPQVIALSKVRVQRGRIGSVLKALGSVTGFVGASVVSGDFDILLQTGGDTFDDVARSLNEVQGTDGIIRTSTAFADGRRRTTNPGSS